MTLQKRATSRWVEFSIFAAGAESTRILAKEDRINVRNLFRDYE